jgi:hypothetical protein
VKLMSRSTKRVKPQIPYVQRPTPVPGEQNTIVVKLAGLRKAALLTCTVGAIHAVLFIAALLILTNGPGVDASNEEIVKYYSNDSNLRRQLVAGLYLMPFAGIAFIWFIVALRAWAQGYVRRQNALLSNVQLVSGIIYTTLFFAGAAAISVTASTAQFSDQIDPDLARLFPQYGANLVLVFAMRMASMFVLTTTNIMRASKVMPKWFAWIGYAVTIFLLLSASFNTLLIFVLPLWILAFCTLVALRARRIPRDGSLIAIEAEGIVLIPDPDEGRSST